MTSVILAIWPSVMNPAVRLVMFGAIFTLAGLGVLTMKWGDRRTRRQRSMAYQTSMAKIGSVTASIAAAMLLGAGIASIALGMADLTK
jgi:hypothetical protein